MKMQAPENCGGLSIAGTSFEVDPTGTADIPDHAVAIAKSHGFTEYAPTQTKRGGRKTDQSSSAVEA